MSPSSPLYITFALYILAMIGIGFASLLGGFAIALFDRVDHGQMK